MSVNCLACSKLQRRSKAGYVRYYCGPGGGEIAREDLNPEPGFLVAACAFGGPFTEEKIMADRIDWKQEYDGKPLWQNAMELRETGLAWVAVAEKLNELYDLQVTTKMCQAKCYYYRKQARPAAAPTSAEGPTIAESAAAALDMADADEPELLDDGKATVRDLVENGLEVRVAPEVRNGSRLLLQLDGVTVDIQAETEELLLQRMAKAEEFFAGVAAAAGE